VPDRYRERQERVRASAVTRLYVVFGPIIAVGAITAGIALAAGLGGFHRDQMLLIAAVMGGIVALPSAYLVFRHAAERSAASRELADIQAQIGGLVESAMDAIITVDDSQRVVQFNAAAERVFRWPRQAVLGQPLDMLMPARFREAHHGHVEAFGHTATTSRSMGGQMVLWGLRADGEEFPIEASISQHEESGRKFFSVILRDVTERVRGEELLARSEARLRGILDSAMDAIITVDDAGHIALFNAAAEKVFDCPRAEAIGAPLNWFIPERFRPGHGEHIRRFRDTHTTSRRMGASRIVMGLRRNGEEFPIDASISQIEEHGRHFFTVILRDVTARVRAEEDLRSSREEIKELALAANHVREQEKSRIARELHDELGQALTALKIDVVWMKQNLSAPTSELAGKLTEMQLLVDGTVAATRRIAADLRPLVLDDLGLGAAAEWLVQSFTARTGCACELAVPGDFELREPYATTVFRVLQESLTNIARHASATRVEVTLGRDGDDVSLDVRDNGRGFVAGGPRKAGSFGLLGVRERAALLGGQVKIESTPGKGTHVELHLKVNEGVAA
jgi:PAS domain S-box-containing protein